MHVSIPRNTTFDARGLELSVRVFKEIGNGREVGRATDGMSGLGGSAEQKRGRPSAMRTWQAADHVLGPAE
jgi:hypothetical protein